MRTMILAAMLAMAPGAAFADCGHRADTRCTLEPGQPPQATPWLRPQERDWWRTVLPGRRRFEAFVDDDGQGCSFMELRDVYGRRVHGVLYEHADFITSLRFTTPAPGTYYVVVAEELCGPGTAGGPMPPGYTIRLAAH